MSTTLPQAIPGAETRAERRILTQWPSIAATGIGCWIGRCFETAPEWRVLGIRWAYGPPAMALGPLGALIYLLIKVRGRRYVLTNTRIKVQSALGDQLIGDTPLESIGEIAMAVRAGQDFYKAADLVLVDEAGEELLRLEGVANPATFRQNILKARDARVQVESSLALIEARGDDD